ncbi:DoxX family protein [Candidatus Sumerlaeota bacterium]|nr:DoxX family protein [Candidatus Sumerlaeota bacterium]
MAARDAAALILRVGMGGAIMLGHGYGKLMAFSASSPEFPDPLGIGHTPSMALAVLAEFFCGLAVILGFATRLALTQLIATMSVAFFIVHAADPYAKKELALVYLIPFIGLFVLGPGRISVDFWVARKWIK